jgi:hypothetical protein
MTAVAAAGFLETAWTALGGPALPSGALRVLGRTGLASPLAVEELALGAVAAQLLAARELARQPLVVELDAAGVGFSFRSERYARQGDRPAGAGFATLSRFWRTADGWIRLHGNYPHHRAAIERVLGPGSPAAAIGRWPGEELEAAVVEEGGAAAVVRTAAEWAAHPQGRAVAALPLLRLTRVADAPPRDVPPAALRVLDLTRVIAGPVATRTLAAHGADVLRLDHPGLPDDPAGLLDTGAGKRSASLDLTTPFGRATLEELLGGADVVVQGYRPGALDAFGRAGALGVPARLRLAGAGRVRDRRHARVGGRPRCAARPGARPRHRPPGRGSGAARRRPPAGRGRCLVRGTVAGPARTLAAQRRSTPRDPGRERRGRALPRRAARSRRTRVAGAPAGRTALAHRPTAPRRARPRVAPPLTVPSRAHPRAVEQVKARPSRFA